MITKEDEIFYLKQKIQDIEFKLKLISESQAKIEKTFRNGGQNNECCHTQRQINENSTKPQNWTFFD